jgi:hypothetical protein
MEDENIEFVLFKVKELNELRRSNRLPTHRNIWQGSYDVWNAAQDYIDATEQPKAAMKKALDEGYICSEEVMVGKYVNVVYRLTELGQEYLRQRQFEKEMQQ